MFEAFIIDDDKFAVEATYHLIPWDEINVTHIQKIYSTVNIVEKIVSEQPDLVFIDIEMGDISGLDIINQCKKNDSKSLFIIISGHDNFAYAQEAVNLGAFHYILKPLCPTDIDIFIEKLKREWKRLDHDISDIFSSKRDFESFITKKLDVEKKYRFIIGEVSKDCFNRLNTILSDAVLDTYKIGSQKYLIVINDELFDSKMIDNLSAILEADSFVMGICDPFLKNGAVYECFNQANILSYQFFITKKGNAEFQRETDITILQHLLDNVIKAIDVSDSAKIERILAGLPTIYIEQNYTMLHVSWFYNSFVGRIKMVLKSGHTFPFKQMNEEELQFNFSDIYELFSTLAASTKDVFVTTVCDECKEKELWEKIVEYIDKNYNKKINAQNVCSALLTNTTSFYNAFKINAGETFIEYLTEFRIQKSKQLLTQTSYPISIIAEMVGFKDIYYYNKVFKKYVGVTPSYFRKQN